jgi:hypothetical protein
MALDGNRIILPMGRFVTPTQAGASHVIIKGSKDLVIDGQGSTLNFASPLCGGLCISNSQPLALKRFNLN